MSFHVNLGEGSVNYRAARVEVAPTSGCLEPEGVQQPLQLARLTASIFGEKKRRRTALAENLAFLSA